MSEKFRPSVAVCVFVFKKGKFLIGKRMGSHGNGTWALPGGHLEFRESFVQAGIREVGEEVGVTIDHVQFAGVTNDFFEAEQRQYATIWLTSAHVSGTV